jgi:hypothetical protein
VIPFLLGVALVTSWLHVRFGSLSGLLFLALATLSPLLLDVTRMARGYGLAFMAMGALFVGAMEFQRSGRNRLLAAFVAGGLLGSLTFPHFAIAFVATAAALCVRRELRVRVLVWSGLTIVATAAWYAPHVTGIARSTLGEYGHPIGGVWIVSAPIDQTLIPAVTLFDDSFVSPSLASLAWAAAFLLVMASSPLLRRTETALVACSGVVATVIAFWATGTYVVPRFFSFLLVPLFALVATGSAAILAQLPGRAAGVRSVVAFTTLAAIAILAVPRLVDVLRLPRDTTSAAATTITSLVPASTRVFAHVAYPNDLEFHLGRSVVPIRTEIEARRLCSSGRSAVYVDQPYLIGGVSVPCTQRAGARRYRFEQYARGHEIDVWVVPAT